MNLFQSLLHAAQSTPRPSSIPPIARTLGKRLSPLGRAADLLSIADFLLNLLEDTDPLAGLGLQADYTQVNVPDGWVLENDCSQNRITNQSIGTGENPGVCPAGGDSRIIVDANQIIGTKVTHQTNMWFFCRQHLYFTYPFYYYDSHSTYQKVGETDEQPRTGVLIPMVLAEMESDPYTDPDALPISQHYNSYRRPSARGRPRSRTALRVNPVVGPAPTAYSMERPAVGTRSPDVRVTTTVWGSGGTSPPILSHGHHYRRRNKNEKKVHFGLHAAPESVRAFVRFLSLMTEGNDLIGAFFNALPDDVQAQCLAARGTTPQAQAACLVANWGQVDFEQALFNAIMNEIQDYIIGSINSAAMGAFGRLGGSHNPTLGGAL